jgi:hypothetical protein
MFTNLLLIVGGGKFGEKAVHFAKNENYRALIIDKDPNCICAPYSKKVYKNFRTLENDLKKYGEEEFFFLNKEISSALPVIKAIDFEYVIPVIPEHLMAHLVKNLLERNSISLRINEKAFEEFLSKVKEELLISTSKEQGLVCLSYAKEGEICPDNCTGPKVYCPNFQREKPVTITNYLKSFYGVSGNLMIKSNNELELYNINESLQLQSGLGGLRGKDIQELFKSIEKHKDSLVTTKFKLIVATSCNCHGVIHFMKCNK